MENGFLKEEEQEFKRFYRLSSWWVNNRGRVRQAGLGLFFALDFALVAFAGWTFLDSFAVSYAQERLAVAEMVAYGQEDLNARTRAEAAVPLEPGTVTVLAVEDGAVDLYAPLVNANQDWWAEITYVFRAGEVATTPKKTFVLPAQEKQLLVFNTKDLGGARTAEVELQETIWHRVDRHLTGEPTNWLEDRLSMTIKDAAFQTDIPLDGKTIGRASFTVTNSTAFSYYDVPFVILLRRGSSVVGVNGTTIASLDAGATQDVSVNWFGALPSASTVEVVLDLNPFDLGVYKPLSGETTSDTRTRVFVR
jgi:hypothetical protein